MNKMKTKINITNYITKGFILAIFAVSLMINTSAQKNQDCITAEKIASAKLLAAEFTGDNDKNALSVAPLKKINTENSLEAFLIKAAGINHPVAEIENENSELTSSNAAIAIESFLIKAADLNKIETSCGNEIISASDPDLENFLVKAAGLDMNNTSIMD